MVSSGQNKLKIQTGNNSSNSDDAQIDKKDDADSTKTIAVTTNEQVRQDEETTDRPIKEMHIEEI